MFETFTEWLKLREKKPGKNKDSHVTADGSRLDSVIKAVDNLEKDWEALQSLTDKKAKEPKKLAPDKDKPDKDKPDKDKPDKDEKHTPFEKGENSDKKPFSKRSKEEGDWQPLIKASKGDKKLLRKPSKNEDDKKPDEEEESPKRQWFSRKKQEPKDVADSRMDVRGSRDLR